MTTPQPAAPPLSDADLEAIFTVIAKANDGDGLLGVVVAGRLYTEVQRLRSEYESPDRQDALEAAMAQPSSLTQEERAARLRNIQAASSVPADLEAAARLTVEDINTAIGLPDGDKPVTDTQLAALLSAATAKALRLASVRMRALEAALKDVCEEAEEALGFNDAPPLREAVKDARALLAPEAAR